MATIARTLFLILAVPWQVAGGRRVRGPAQRHLTRVYAGELVSRRPRNESPRFGRTGLRLPHRLNDSHVSRFPLVVIVED